MIFREAGIADIPQIQRVRHAVRENRLSDPALVTDADCEEYLCKRGKGWVCENNKQVLGFAIADLQDQNIWALFVDPGFEKQGIGKSLQRLMLDWYFRHKTQVWLSTAPGTRAETFYTMQGWTACGYTKSGEMRFEMQAADWQKRQF